MLYISAYTGEEIDRRLAYVGYLEQLNSEPVGMKIENASSSPKTTVVDRNGNPLTPDADFFHNHVIWGSRYKCVIDPKNGNKITFGKNPRGDGLTLDGSAGNVMVRIPNVKYRYELDGTDQYIWYAPFDSNAPYFDYFPTCYQGTGKLHDHFYMAAYEASGFFDTADSKFKLISATGKQPITGGVGYPDLPNDGRFTIDDALTYSGNIGTGWSIGNVWSYAQLQGLSYIQYGTRDLQTAVGKGIVDLPPGDAGKLTGSDDIDNRLDIWGCGVGSGVNGQTPTASNNLENFVSGGNVWEFIAGINMMNSDGSVRVVNPDGTGILAGSLAAGNYITLPNKVPMTDGYISGIQTDSLGAITFIPSAVTGSSSTYFADNFWYPRYSPSVVHFGGNWDDGLAAGVGCRNATDAPSISYRTIGARLEFHPNEVVA